MAKISTRKRGKYWEYRFEIAKSDGKRKQFTKSGFLTKKDALQAGSVAYSEYNQSGLTFRPSEISFSDYMDYWMEHYVQVNCVNSTYTNYKKKIKNHIIPTLGNYKLKDINATALQNLINQLYNNGYSRNTLTVIKGILTGALAYAVEPCQFIKNSPAVFIKLPAKRAASDTPTRKKQRDFIEKDVWEQIINRFPEGTTAHIPLMLGYHCGLRIAEAFALTWDDFNYQDKTLTIQRQIQYDEELKIWKFKAPKYDSYRTLSIDQELCELLQREKEKQQENKALYDVFWQNVYIRNSIPDGVHLFNNGELNENEGILIDLILRRENGEYTYSRIMQHVCRVIHGKANDKAKAKRNTTSEPAICNTFDFHSLRHTHGTILLEQGIPLPLIQERLGHADIDMTEIYTNHTTNTMKNTLSKELNNIFLSAK